MIIRCEKCCVSAIIRYEKCNVVLLPAYFTPETMPKCMLQADFALIGLFGENITANNGGK
jgi:hypothetical protein